MIELTKLNNEALTINAVYIERVEATPDTVITLTSGKKLLVLESVTEVTEKVTNYYRKINLFQETKEGPVDV